MPMPKALEDAYISGMKARATAPDTADDLAQVNLGKYLAGEPINEELAAVRDGRESFLPPEVLSQHQHQSTVLDGPITRADRVALKELMLQPGWLVVRKVLEKATLEHQQSAILLSQNDPLANAQKIAEAWAYLQMFKRVIDEVEIRVADEIAALEVSDEAKHTI